VVGKPADLCFVNAECIPEAIVMHLKRKLVVKHGRVVTINGAFLDNAIMKETP
jgi:hypothetical protein